MLEWMTASALASKADEVDIFTAVERKNLRELKRILKNDPLAARRTDCWGRTALMLACVEGDESLARLLLPLSDPKASDRDGETALMLASFGHPACVELLLPVSDARARDGDGWTALMWAMSSGSPRCVELLPSDGALVALAGTPPERAPGRPSAPSD